MKSNIIIKTLIVSSLLFFAGCTEPVRSTLAINNINVGMTEQEVRKQYNSVPLKVKEAQSEKEGCIEKTYRYTVVDGPNQENPYLLTFRNCESQSTLVQIELDENTIAYGRARSAAASAGIGRMLEKTQQDMRLDQLEFDRDMAEIRSFNR